MERLGIAFSGGPSPAEIVDCIVLAESLGYELAWVAEGHGGDAARLLGKEAENFLSGKLFAEPNAASVRVPCAWKDRSARSRSIMLTFPWMLSPSVGCENITTLAHRDAVRRGIHSITGDPFAVAAVAVAARQPARISAPSAGSFRRTG